jgi:hypothetical protein
LRHEKRLRDQVETNIKARSGITLPVEDRILKSIARAEKASGISLDAVDPRSKRSWGGRNIYERTRDVGLEALYLAAFGGGSHSVHGNWQEVYGAHLEWGEDGQFKPKTD